MKRILLPAGGAVLATGLLAAGLAGTASATPAPQDEYLAKSTEIALSTIDFWTKSNNYALKQATAYHWDYKEVKKLVSKGGYTADTKPGVVAPIGEEKKVAAKVHNVNVPKTIGKVFFETRDGKLQWCTGTSIQSNYKNLVATAGHCVYDLAANNEVVSRWVFVPGYYQGKTPFGIFVGKQAFTHYDFDIYEDFDRDYAFVTVYNGIGGVGASEVSYDTWKAHTGRKDVKWEKIKVTEAEYKEWVGRTGNTGEVVEAKAKQTTGPEDKRGVYEPLEVKKDVYTAAAPQTEVKVGAQAFVNTEIVSEDEAKKYEGPGEVVQDAVTKQWKINHYFVKQWVIPGSDAAYYINKPHFIIEKLVDTGRLGDVVGGQGFAYNQPTGKYVRTFGYPYAEHPDGSKPYTGVTVKNCYGKTSAKLVGSAAKKIEEHVALKCAMTPGADGGPWLLKYSNAKRLGYVNGVTSTFNDQDSNDRIDYISSPYFDGETNTVYKAAANTASGKILPTASN
ncbi:trypsin-like serine peptidase [Nonomuraea dietziae]|uniref:trypsin-like serine peptidase n=1 Tax=Nonomuraea dietziae TaxID=65515 RepID=UPI003432C492